MDREYAINKGLELIKRSKIAIIGTVDETGHPQIKAMLNLLHEGIRKIWFSTNTSSRRVTQIQRDGRSSVYYVDPEGFL